jgi:hypothetical protein
MARKYENGVTQFTFAEATIQVHFPETDVCCRWCPFLKHYDSMDRDKCALTEEILYSKETRGYNCPLVILNTVNVEELK